MWTSIPIATGRRLSRTLCFVSLSQAGQCAQQTIIRCVQCCNLLSLSFNDPLFVRQCQWHLSIRKIRNTHARFLINLPTTRENQKSYLQLFTPQFLFHRYQSVDRQTKFSSFYELTFKCTPSSYLEMMLRILVSLCGGIANRSSLEFWWSESPMWLRRLSSDVCSRWISRSHCSIDRGARRRFPSVWMRPGNFKLAFSEDVQRNFSFRWKSLPSVSVELSDKVRADSKLRRRWYLWWWWSRVGLMNAWFSTGSSRLY